MHGVIVFVSVGGTVDAGYLASVKRIFTQAHNLDSFQSGLSMVATHFSLFFLLLHSDIPVVVALSRVDALPGLDLQNVYSDPTLKMHRQRIVDAVGVNTEDVYPVRNLYNQTNDTPETKAISAALTSRLLWGIVQKAASYVADHRD